MKLKLVNVTLNTTREILYRFSSEFRLRYFKRFFFIASLLDTIYGNNAGHDFLEIVLI